MLKSELFIKKSLGLDLWTVNIKRVKIGTIRKRENKFIVHLPSMVIGGVRYPEKNFYAKDLNSAYAICSNAWRNERADLKFDILREALAFEREKIQPLPRAKSPRRQPKTYGDFSRSYKGKR